MCGNIALTQNIKFYNAIGSAPIYNHIKLIQKLKATLTIVANVAIFMRDKHYLIVPDKYQQSVPSYAREHRTAGLFSIIHQRYGKVPLLYIVINKTKKPPNADVVEAAGHFA